MVQKKMEKTNLTVILFYLFLFVLLWTPAMPEGISIPAIIQIESSGNPTAYNPKSGCIGLMGIHPKGALADWNEDEEKVCRETYLAGGGRICPEYVKFHNIGDLYNPEVNVKIGTYYLNTKIPQYLETWGIPDTVENRLICYCWGPTAFKNWYNSGKPLPAKVRRYLKKYRRLTE